MHQGAMTIVCERRSKMAKIKHIAIATQNEEETARFYVEVFGLTEIAKLNSPIVSGYFLTDGTINLAILHFKNDQVAGVEWHPPRRVRGRELGGDRAEVGGGRCYPPRGHQPGPRHRHGGRSARQR